MFAFFEKNRKKTESLDLIYNALLTIKPTSVEAERNFSAAGFFLSNLKSWYIGSQDARFFMYNKSLFFERKHPKI